LVGLKNWPLSRIGLSRRPNQAPRRSGKWLKGTLYCRIGVAVAPCNRVCGIRSRIATTACCVEGQVQAVRIRIVRFGRERFPSSLSRSGSQLEATLIRHLATPVFLRPVRQRRTGRRKTDGFIFESICSPHLSLRLGQAQRKRRAMLF